MFDTSPPGGLLELFCLCTPQPTSGWRRPFGSDNLSALKKPTRNLSHSTQGCGSPTTFSFIYVFVFLVAAEKKPPRPQSNWVCIEGGQIRRKEKKKEPKRKEERGDQSKQLLFNGFFWKARDKEHHSFLHFHFYFIFNILFSPCRYLQH